MLWHPTDRNFLGMVRGGMISNCPMTTNAVKKMLTKSLALTLQE